MKIMILELDLNDSFYCLKCNYPMTRSVRLSAGCLVGRSVLVSLLYKVKCQDEQQMCAYHAAL